MSAGAAPASSIERVGIVGGGIMDTGIAANLLGRNTVRGLYSSAA